MRITVPIGLRWSDFDPYAHVNNAEMFRLLEEARVQAFWRPDDGTEGPPSAVLDTSPGSPMQSLIAHQEIDYLRPIPYMRAPIEIEMWVGRLGGASLDLCYEVFSPVGVEPRHMFVRAATTIVLVSAETGKPTRMTGEQRAAWTPYVEAPIDFARRH
jgi:acyl-CoA thioester hydrolase